MKITSLALHRFRSAVDLILPLDAPRVLVSGRNNTGKTSVREAIQWALLGHCLGTDARGSGWESLIPHSVPNEGLAVSLQADQLGAVTRRYAGSSRSFSVEGVTGEAGIQQAGVFAKLGTTPAYLEAVLDSSYFLGLHHASAKALVLELLNVRIPIGEESLTLDQVEGRYKVAFEERKLAKGRLKAHSVPAKPSDEGTPMPPLEAIASQLAKVRTELQAASKASGSTAGKRELLERRLREAERLETVPSGVGLSEKILSLEEQIRGLDIAETFVPLAVISEDLSIEEVRQRIDALKGHKPTKGCVLDPDVPCDTSKAKFTNRAKELAASLPPVQEAQPASQIDRRDVERRLLELRLLQQTIVNVEAQNEARRGIAEGLRTELSSLVDDTEGQAAIDALQARIRKGELLQDRAATYWQAVERFDRAVAEHTKLEADVARLEAACDQLGPNGARVGALRSAIGAFETKVNGFTGRFGWELAFTLEPWAVLVNSRPVETYSRSEQFRIGIALQLAIAELSGLSFAVVDELDMLDVENRKLASKMILEAPVGQVILLATREPEQPLPASSDTLFCYRLGLEAGQTVVLEAREAVPA